MKKINLETIHNTLDKSLLEIDPLWENVVKPITLLKDAIDRVVEGRTGKPQKEFICTKDRKILAEHGIDADQLRALDKEGSGAIQGPTNFIQLILGPFGESSSLPIKQVYIPPWATIGHNFRYFGKQEVKERKDIEQTTGKPARATSFGGIPLFAAGEGKNRCSLHRQNNWNQLVFINNGFYPDPSELLMQPVLFHPDFVVLHRTMDGFRVSVLLPFPKLSIPLLKAYGVSWSHKGVFLLFSKVRPSLAKHGKVDQPFPWAKRLAIAIGKCSLRDRLLFGT